MNKDLVLFKNSPERLLIILDSNADFSEILENISQKIRSNYNFFKGVSLRLKYSGRELSGEEEAKIICLFEKTGDMDIVDIGREIVVPQSEAGNDFRGIAYGLFDEDGGIRKPVKKLKNILQISEGLVSCYRGDLCKGQKIKYKGTVVVIGDVKAGSEVIASENIIVFGKVNGSVHAGGKNLKTAVIICEKFNSAEFSIAGISRADEKFKSKNKSFKRGFLFGRKRPEMKILSLDNNRIVIDTLSDL